MDLKKCVLLIIFPRFPTNLHHIHTFENRWLPLHCFCSCSILSSSKPPPERESSTRSWRSSRSSLRTTTDPSSLDPSSLANWLQNGGLIGRAVLNRDINNLDFTDAHPPALSEEDINSLPLLRYKVRQPNEPGEGSEGMELICCVCLEQVNAGDIIRTLPCRYQLHLSMVAEEGDAPIL